MGDLGTKSRFGLVYFSLFAIYGVASPYLQLLVRGLGYGPVAVGLFLGLFEVVGIAGPLAIARVADRSGRFKPSLYACAVLTCLPLAPLVLLRGPLATALFLIPLMDGIRVVEPCLVVIVLQVTLGRVRMEERALDDV